MISWKWCILVNNVVLNKNINEINSDGFPIKMVSFEISIYIKLKYIIGTWFVVYLRWRVTEMTNWGIYMNDRLLSWFKY